MIVMVNRSGFEDHKQFPASITTNMLTYDLNKKYHVPVVGHHHCDWAEETLEIVRQLRTTRIT